MWTSSRAITFEIDLSVNPNAYSSTGRAGLVTLVSVAFVLFVFICQTLIPD